MLAAELGHDVNEVGLGIVGIEAEIVEIGVDNHSVHDISSQTPPTTVAPITMPNTSSAIMQTRTASPISPDPITHPSVPRSSVFEPKVVKKRLVIEIAHVVPDATRNRSNWHNSNDFKEIKENPG